MTQETLERIKLEKEELTKKIYKLDTFIYSSVFLDLSYANMVLLEEQLFAMRKYQKALLMRIELNEKNIDYEKQTDII